MLKCLLPLTLATPLLFAGCAAPYINHDDNSSSTVYRGGKNDSKAYYDSLYNDAYGKPTPPPQNNP